MNNNLLDYYLCDGYTDTHVYTITKCQEILNHFNKENRDNQVFDFRSKEYIAVNTIKHITPKCTNIAHNPYIQLPSGDEYVRIINKSKEHCSFCYAFASDIFTNTVVTSNIDKYGIAIQIINLCPFFNKTFFEVILTDNGTTSYLLKENFELIQRACIAALYNELSITEYELFDLPIDELIQKCKSFWIDLLDHKRKEVIKSLNDSLVTLRVDESSEGICKVYEIRKEIATYEKIDIANNVNKIDFIGDMYRYFPFNCNEQEYADFINKFAILKLLKLMPVNRWHHKYYCIAKQLLSDTFITYYDIEENTNLTLSVNLSVEKARQIKRKLALLKSS